MIASLALVLALAAVAGADEPPELPALFPQQADVMIEPPGGLVRLDLPPAVVGACRPDLSDLRVLDHAGREVPYLIDAGLPPRGWFETKEIVDGRLIDVRREETKRETGPARQREVYVLEAPGVDPENGAWDLVLTTDGPAFVRRIDVGVVQQDGSVAPLVENGSVFRLTNPQREKVRLPLPHFGGPRIAVTLEGEEGTYLAPTFRFENTQVTPARDQAVVPLRETARRRADGRTVVELERPHGLVPGSLRLETSTRSFNRAFEVWDEGDGIPPLRIGQGTLFRVEGVALAEERDLPLAPARSARLRIEIIDGDSPALDGLAFAAIVSRPALIFSLASDTAAAPSATLYFGGGRAYPPRYDLAAFGSLLSGTSTMARAVAAKRLQELDRAQLGEARDNPLFDTTPALAFAMHAGAEIDPRLFSHRRTVRVMASPDGLTRLTLRPEDLAHARGDLGDVRIVDDDARQWPYLLERDATREWQAVGVTRTRPRRGVSRYRLALPADNVRVAQVRLTIDTTFFDRPFRLLGGDDDQARVLARGRLARHARPASDVTIVFPPEATAALVLDVENGDDAPLEVQSAQAELLLPDLFLAAPAGDYALLVGNPDAGAPRYELERVRDVVLAVRSTPPVVGEAVANPTHSASARLTSGEQRETVLPQLLLWSALLGGVAVLTVITLRLARRPADGDAS